MLKSSLSFGLILLSLFAYADNPHHTGQLLFKLKSEPHSALTIQARGHQDLDQLRSEMLATGQYEYVVYNTFEQEPEVPPVDMPVTAQWHHKTIDSFSSWNFTLGSEDIVVAVCDSGIQSNHEALLGRVLPGWNLVDNNDEQGVTTGHGTFVAGIIAASLGQFEAAGVAPNVKLLPLRISNTRGGTTMKLITDCITLAADRGAKVINVSFTGVESPAVEAAGRYAASKGALLVYSAGNHGRYRSVDSYPVHPHVLVVGATNEQEQRWNWRRLVRFGGSNYGPFVDISAPGHNMLSTRVYSPQDLNQAKYGAGNGTSFSAPVVSGVAALVYSINPKFTPEQVRSILLDSSDDIGVRDLGAGRVNAHRAVLMATELSR
jgi:subtilisin family serine protease